MILADNLGWLCQQWKLYIFVHIQPSGLDMDCSCSLAARLQPPGLASSCCCCVSCCCSSTGHRPQTSSTKESIQQLNYILLLPPKFRLYHSYEMPLCLHFDLNGREAIFRLSASTSFAANVTKLFDKILELVQLMFAVFHRNASIK